ncbi:MAG: adenylate/guanylate cyclase domain-containing protein [Phycisphaerae bacterium]
MAEEPHPAQNAAQPTDPPRMLAAVSPGSRPRFIEETGVRMRWVLIAAGCVLQLVNTIIPYPFFFFMVAVAVLYNGTIHLLLRRESVNFRILGVVTCTMDVLVSVALVYAGGDSDLYLWYFVLFIAHAARFSTRWAMVLTVVLIAAYVGGLLVRAAEISPAVLNWQTLFTRVLFALLATLLGGYLATQERQRFENILHQQREMFLLETHRRRMLQAIERYVGADVAKGILNDPDGVTALGGARRNVTVLFADIQGFTPMAALIPPERVVQLLNAYFTEVTKMVFQHGGALDKFIGDAVVAVFGVPQPREDDALRAVRAAMAMQSQLEHVRQEWKAIVGKHLKVRIGLESGWAIVGNIGSPQRMDYTVIGDVVNTASRLQNLAPPGSIVMGEATYAALAGKVPARLMPPTEIRGKEGAGLKLYEVAACEDSGAPATVS